MKRAHILELIDKDNLTVLRQFIADKINPERYSLYSADITKSISHMYTDKLNDFENQLLIEPFFRDGFNQWACLPGSSLKGAIRTAVLDELGHNPVLNEEERRDTRLVEPKILKYVEPRQGRERAEIRKDPFRTIKIRDIPLPEKSTLITRVENMAVNSRNGRLSPTGVSMNCEVTHSPMTGKSIPFTGELVIAPELAEKRGVSDRLDTASQPNGIISFICSSCNNFYQDCMQKEYEKFYQDQQEVGKYSQKLLDTKLGKNECLIRVGRFSHVEGVTLNPPYRHPYNRKYGSSRNLCEGLFPMGWIKLKFVKK